MIENAREVLKEAGSGLESVVKVNVSSNFLHAEEEGGGR